MGKAYQDSIWMRVVGFTIIALVVLVMWVPWVIYDFWARLAHGGRSDG